MKMDGNFEGTIRKAKNGNIVPEDEWIVFLAKDNAVPSMLEHYLQTCVRLGANQRQVQAVNRLLARVNDWRDAHPERLKTPDIDQDERILA